MGVTLQGVRYILSPLEAGDFDELVMMFREKQFEEKISVIQRLKDPAVREQAMGVAVRQIASSSPWDAENKSYRKSAEFALSIFYLLARKHHPELKLDELAGTVFKTVEDFEKFEAALSMLGGSDPIKLKREQKRRRKKERRLQERQTPIGNGSTAPSVKFTDTPLKKSLG